MSQLDELIQFWKDWLAETRFIMNPDAIYLVEQTIKRLEELKQLKKGE